MLDDVHLEHLITWRWLSVVRFCILIEPVLPDMVATWDPEKFMFKHDSRLADDPDASWQQDRIKAAASVEIKAVTSALRSKEFVFCDCDRCAAV
jgi:hypothetical protein